jgi:hypothetical protein
MTSNACQPEFLMRGLLRRPLVATLAFSVLAGACAGTFRIEVPTASETIDPAYCGAHVSAVRLDGDPEATPPVWVNSATGTRFDVVWPPGSYAELGLAAFPNNPSGPRIELYTASGTLIATRSDELDLYGRTLADGRFEVCTVAVALHAE